MWCLQVFGRLRLTIQLARLTLSIPMAIDTAMREDNDDVYSQRSQHVESITEGPIDALPKRQGRGLLPGPVKGVLTLAVAALEKGESVL